MKNILLIQVHLRGFLVDSFVKEKKPSFFILSVLSLLFFCCGVSAQVTTSSGFTAAQYVERIIGQGIEYHSPMIIGNSTQIANYTGGNTTSGMPPTMGSGLVMGTGPVVNPTTLHGPASKFLSTSVGTGGFTELNTLAGISSTFDGIGLQFTFIPLTDKLKINFQFGSEEYNEYVGSSYNDVFGFFISGPGISTPPPGVNIALAPPNVRVSVNTINNGYSTGCGPGPGTNSQYYIDNCGGTYNNAMDGFTMMLTAEADVIPCEEYVIRLLLADGTDSVYDSWVFLQESGFYADGVIVDTEVTHVDPEMDYIYEGCSGSEISFCIPKALDYNYVIDVDWTVDGNTATWGVDYLPLPSSIIIPAGQTCVSIPVVVLSDGIEEGVETIVGEYQKDVCNRDHIIIEINDMPTMTVEFDVGEIEECYDPENPIALAPIITDNVGSVTYVWNDGVADFSTDEQVTVNPEETTTYTVNVIDACGVEESASITIIRPDQINPLFSVITTYCVDGTPDVLPNTSNNGIVGVWSPDTISTAVLGVTTYVFTPDPGQCGEEVTLDITIDEETIPTFNPITSTICQNGFIAATSFPTVSTNQITGTWSPAPNNQATTTYTFTPNPGQCAAEFTRTITVNPTVTANFSSLPSVLCQGTNFTFPSTSDNNITGTWFPQIGNQPLDVPITYTFQPAAGQCSSPRTHTLTIKSTVAPTFNPVAAICAGDSLSPLPTMSTNAISGTWSPALNNQVTTTYTFTPFTTGTQCATPYQMTIVVNPQVTPTFAASLPSTICETAGYVLPTPNNGVTGTWSPSLSDHVPDTTVEYTFTPLGTCPVDFRHDIYMEPALVPDFDQVGPTCSGELIDPLPTTDNNGITGTWSPALNYNQTTTYTFTPSAGICAAKQTMTIVVTQPATPQFTQVPPICAGEPLAALPTSSGGVTGTWSPAIDNTQTTTYTFTPDPGQCTLGTNMTIVVNQWITPEFNIGGICAGGDSPLPTTSLNGVTGTWSPEFDNTQTGTYTFTPDPGQCGVDGETVTVIVVGSVTTPVLVPLEYCDPNSDGYGVFDLTQVTPIIESVNTVPVVVTFHETIDDANFNANDISDNNPETAYPNGQSYLQTIYVRVSNDSGCYAVIPLDLIVHNLPQITKVVSILNECDDDLDGEAIFDLSDSLSAIMNTLHVSDYTISYHQNESDARGNTSPILGFTNYNSSSGSVWVRVESNDTGCFDVVEVELIVHPLPVVSLPEVERYVLCDDNYDGYADFDLASRIAGIVNGQSGLTVTFHDTYEDADSKTGAYDINVLHTNNEQTVETVFVRVETEQGCYVITLLDLVVEPLPILFPVDPIEVCDGDTDGLGAIIDFTDTIEQMLNAANPNDYTITIHETYDDAFFKGSSIDDITAYYNTEAFLQVVYLRIESVSGEGCFNIYPITINISVSPQLPIAQDGTLPDLVVCDDNTDGITTFDFTSQTQYILASQVSTTDLLITYHQSEQHAIDGVLAISQVTNYQNLSNPQTIWVRLENTLTGCSDVASFDLIVNLPLEIPLPVPSITLCDEDMDGTITFDLTIRIPDILINTSNPDNFEVEFFTSRLDAVNGNLSERIDTPESYSMSGHVQTLGIRVTNKTTGCMSYTIMDIRRAPMPSVPDVPLEAMEKCQDPDSPIGFAFFDLTEREIFIRQGDTNLIITYHLNLEDAELGQNEIVPANNFLSENRTIYIRVANTPNGGITCGRILTVDLLVHPLPVIADNGFEICETNTTGFATFYLRDFNSDLLGPTQNQSDFTIAYYLTEAAAIAQTSPPMNQNLGYTNQTQYAEVIWVRITNNATGCSIIDEITLYVEEAAQATQPVNNDIFECDYDGVNDGITSGIDLTVYQNEILGGQDPLQFLVSYHTDEQEANQGLNAIGAPDNFTNTIAGGQTIWVRVENSLTNAPCYALATIELIVEELANPVIDTANDVLCITFGETVAQNPVVLDSGISTPGFIFEWYHNGSLVAGATQSTLTLDTLGEEGMYSVIAISPNGCISESSEDFEVFLSGLPEIVNITTTNAFQDQQDIIVTVQGYGVYAFQLNDGPLQDTGHFTNVPPGTHTVMVYDITSGNINGANSCGNLPIPNIELINYPKFFTPNGDGYNETWNITGLTAFHNAEIYIFDRYGKLLKQLNPEGEGWDGTFNGNQLPSTDYWFKVLYDEQDTRREFKAHFSMKR